MYISLFVQKRLLSFANVEIISHSGKISTLPQRIKHFGTEMLKPGYYGVFHNRGVVDHVTFSGDIEEEAIQYLFQLLVETISNEERKNVSARVDFNIDAGDHTKH